MILAGELFDRLVAHLTRKTLFYGFYPYQVTIEANGRPSLRVLDAIDGLPGQLYLDKAHGIQGVSSALPPDALVLVGFQRGDAARPYVAFYLPGPLPLAVQLDAQNTITLGTDAAADQVALATPTQAAINTIIAKVNQLCTLASIPGIGLLNPVASSKVRAE
jgi:hypothetical protein